MIKNYFKIINLAINITILEIKIFKEKSILGYWWTMINNSIIILIVGFAYVNILKIDNVNYIPHLSFGYILWIWISASLIEGSTVLLHNEAKIKQSNVDYFLYTLVSNFKNFISFIYNLPLFFFLVIFFKLKISFFSFFIFLFFIFLILLNIIFLSFILAVLVVRFRDIEKFLISILQIMFFLTPIIWMEENFNSNLIILTNMNMLYHWIENCRLLLIFDEFSVLHFSFSIFSLLILVLLFFQIKKNIQKKLIFWF
jgi:ABC-2 type transport system permease protein